MASLITPDQFSANQDAEALRKACQGWGTNEKAVISILGHRNAGQRKEIRAAYEQLYQEDLLKRLESELSGDFEKAVYRWILDPADRDAVLANVAIKKSTDYNVIIEISCIHSPEELLAVRRAYQLRYKHSVEEDLAAHTTGDIRKLLVALVTAYRYDGHEINAKLANSEADILQDAIKDKAFNLEEIIRILSTRSKTQLMATFNKYRDDQGISISKNLLEEGANDFQKALHTAIRCLNDPKKYFEKVLRNAIKRVGTDEDALTRVIVTRAERDLRDIKEVYYKKNSVPLEQAVAKDTSGDYKAFLLTLLGKED
ncbi:PREDICTED: annexin-like protein RJ4 isoform X2 [Fragaria vesca subsp. vesca]|uniref:annexin-like protein RJ4 isoform X2 n=1 Tax=Fragaria vesca subsp. vesca TaxID=101020 RepID=UPI0002C307DF|nr:PREDICTED: annexin-like protein RJ4 isoform X2 [Fragaria vesca subsp. vesca]